MLSFVPIRERFVNGFKCHDTTSKPRCVYNWADSKDSLSSERIIMGGNLDNS